MAAGKIKTLYSDKEKTEALFPRTKTSAVSDADGVGLDAFLDNMVHVGDIVDTATAPIDADSLGGLPASNYATQSFVSNKIAEAQLSGGDGSGVDLSGYATKDDLNKIDFPVDSVNGKTGVVNLSASDVGAAPAGFGYGDRMTYVDMTAAPYNSMTFADALDSVMTTMPGYSVAQIQIYDPDFPHTSNKCFCTLWKYTSNYATLECISYSGYKAIMRKTSGAWGGWELDNPPLTEFSTVYPTTERYRGKVVYVVQYDVGVLANNGKTTVEHGLKIAHHELVRCVGFAQHISEYRYYGLPMINSTGQVVATIQLSSTAINIHTFSDLSAYKGIVTLYFTGD